MSATFDPAEELVDNSPGAMTGEWDIGDPRPSPRRAHLLRTSVNSQLCDSLRSALGAVRQVLPKQAAAADAVVAALDVHRRIAPGVFSQYHHLSSGVREQNIAQVVTALAQLRLRHENNALFSDELEVSPLKWDESDCATAQYIFGPLGPRGPNGELGEMLDIPKARFDECAAQVRPALELLRTSYVEMYGEIDALVACIRLMDGEHIGSVSSPRSFGLIHLAPPTSPAERADPLLHLILLITHETSHIVLNAMMTHDPLVLNDPAERYSSPLRRDPRPISGIYHAVFVLSRIVHVLGLVRHHHDTPLLSLMIESSTSNMRKALDTVQENGRLSPDGRRLLDSCATLVDRP